jgi:hypothetical protein
MRSMWNFYHLSVLWNRFWMKNFHYVILRKSNSDLILWEFLFKFLLWIKYWKFYLGKKHFSSNINNKLNITFIIILYEKRYSINCLHFLILKKLYCFSNTWKIFVKTPYILQNWSFEEIFVLVNNLRLWPKKQIINFIKYNENYFIIEVREYKNQEIL